MHISLKQSKSIETTSEPLMNACCLAVGPAEILSSSEGDLSSSSSYTLHWAKGYSVGLDPWLSVKELEWLWEGFPHPRMLARKGQVTNTTRSARSVMFVQLSFANSYIMFYYILKKASWVWEAELGKGKILSTNSFGTFHVKLFLGSNVWLCAGCGKKSTEFWDFCIFWRKPETPKERACPPSLDRDIIQSKQNRYISSWPVYPPYSLADVNQMPFQFWEIFEDAVVVFVLDLIQKPYRCFPALKEITIVIKTLYSFQQM